MSNIGEVTLSISEFDNLREKAKALDAIEYNNAYIIYQISDSRWYAWKSYAGYGDNLIEAFQLENKLLQEQLKASENEVKDLKLRMSGMTIRKKWWQLW
jgi:hypothetical protein